MSLHWPIKECSMDYVKGDQGEHPYVVVLKYGIEANLSECCVQRDLCELRVV